MLRRSLHKSFFSKCSILPGKFSTGWKRTRKKIIKKNTTKEEENGTIEVEVKERGERKRERFLDRHTKWTRLCSLICIFLGFFGNRNSLGGHRYMQIARVSFNDISEEEEKILSDIDFWQYKSEIVQYVKTISCINKATISFRATQKI